MKIAIASAAAYLALLTGALDATMAGCFGGDDGKTRPGKNSPAEQTVPVQQMGDGIMVVGEDISPGRWQSPANWKDQKGCVWFVSPAQGKDESLPTYRRRDEYAGRVTFTLRKGQSLTSSGCTTDTDVWERIGN